VINVVAGFLLCWCVSFTSLPNATPHPCPEKMQVNDIFDIFVTADTHVQHTVNNIIL
jgi:hypothetical protein